LNKLRIIYAGTPDFSVPALAELHKEGHEIVAVLTQPDRPSGRGQKVKQSPGKDLALDLGLNVLQPLSLRKAKIKKQLRQLNADVMVVAAYGLILPQSVLDMPRLGCINIHASLLPRWRGAAPIHRAIQAGDQESGITIMQMDAGLDTGDILSMHPIAIEASDTSQTLHDRLSALGAAAITSTLSEIDQQVIKPVKQNDSDATYAVKLTKKEAEIDWHATAMEIEQMVRAFDPWPCTYTHLEGEHLKIWAASLVESPRTNGHKEATIGTVIAISEAGIDVKTGKGILRILELQLSGRKRMTAQQFCLARQLNGIQLGQV